MERSSEEKIMDLIFLLPTTRLSYREITRQTKVSIGSVSKFIPKLEKEGLLVVESMPNAKYVTGNIEDEKFKKKKRIYNMSLLYDTGLVDNIEKKLRPTAIILFGSFGKGLDIESSDIDICVIGGRKSGYNTEKFEKLMQRQINITRITNLKKERREFRQALNNGFVLSGYLV